MWHWHKDRHIDFRNKIESLVICPHIWMVKWFLTWVPRPFNVERTVCFQPVVFGKLDVHVQKSKSWTLILYHLEKFSQNVSKIWRVEAIKNIREKIHHIGFVNDFFAMKQETQETEGKLLEWKIKTFYMLKKWSESHSVVSDSLWPHGLYSPWNSAGQNTGVNNLSFLQGIFPTQRLNPGLSHIAGGFFTIWAIKEAQEYWSG